MQTKHIVFHLPALDHLLATKGLAALDCFKKPRSVTDRRTKEMLALYKLVDGDHDLFIAKAWNAYRLSPKTAEAYYCKVKKLS